MHDHRLETFVQVVDAGSFSKSAEALFVSAVSVMKQVNALEAMAGTKLLERSNQGVRPTTAGRVFYDEAHRIIRLSGEALRHVREVAETQKHVIRVGSSLLRPCRTLIDLWTRVGADTPFRIEIVPFNDHHVGLSQAVDSLGRDMDCFVGPCDSVSWMKTCSVHLLGEISCCIGAPQNHRLANRTSLTWDDLKNETLMLMRRGDSLVLDRLRDDIEHYHPDVKVRDVDHFYDTQAFNECVREGCLMETLDIWADVHPDIKTLPMNWDYTIPYGIIYAAEPSDAVATFVAALNLKTTADKGTESGA